MLKNFILETANAPGTSSAVTLAGASTGRLSFAQGFATGASCFYFMDDGSQAEWGIATFTAGTPNTLTRTTVEGNTAGNTSRLNFAGTVYVYNEVPAENSIYIDGSRTAKAPEAVFDPFSGGVPIGAGMDYWIDGPAPAGWVFPYGQDLSRTTYAKLWAAMGSPNTGDGSTTFTMFDKRGRVSVAKDNLGGTAANRVTAAVSGFAANTVGGTGGDQRAQADTLTATSNAASSATSNATSVVNDPGHAHTASTGQFLVVGVAGANYAPGSSTASNVTFTADAATGITVSTSVATSVTTTVTTHVTSGLTGASQNMPPGIACNYIVFAGA